VVPERGVPVRGVGVVGQGKDVGGAAAQVSTQVRVWAVSLDFPSSALYSPHVRRPA